MIFEQVTATTGLYRGSHPDPEKDIPRMAVKTILNLENDLVSCLAEKLACKRAGIEYVQVSMDDFKVPSATTLVGIADLIVKLPRPLLVHCAHGHERTGIAIASFRILWQSWEAKRAIREMYAQGFTRWYFWWPRVLHIIGKRMK